MKTHETNNSTFQIPTPKDIARLTEERQEATRKLQGIGEAVVYTTSTDPSSGNELGARLDPELVDALYARFQGEAEDVFGDDYSPEQTKYVYDLVEQLKGNGSHTIQPVRFKPGESESNEYPVRDISGTKRMAGKATDYVIRVERDEAGDPTAYCAYPVDYEYGNGVLVGRDFGDGQLEGLDELLADPELTKDMLRQITGGRRIKHVDGPEAVSARINYRLTCSQAAFGKDNYPANVHQQFEKVA